MRNLIEMIGLIKGINYDGVINSLEMAVPEYTIPEISLSNLHPSNLPIWPFMFIYDKLQLIQSRNIPEYIEDADCKLALYRNCRNTENIAITSLKPISEREPKLFDGGVSGAPAKFYFCSSEKVPQNVDSCIEKMQSEGFKNIVILSCKTESHSDLKKYIKEGKYKGKYRFSTCRKFKGLEADAVIMVDVDAETFNQDNVFLFYVGASRAKIKLDIVTTIDDDTHNKLLNEKLDYKGKIIKILFQFAQGIF